MNKTLTTLQLCKNGLGPEGGKAIAKCVEVNSIFGVNTNLSP
jgi:hypothetical protein